MLSFSREAIVIRYSSRELLDHQVIASGWTEDLRPFEFRKGKKSGTSGWSLAGLNRPAGLAFEVEEQVLLQVDPEGIVAERHGVLPHIAGHDRPGLLRMGVQVVAGLDQGAQEPLDGVWMAAGKLLSSDDIPLQGRDIIIGQHQRIVPQPLLLGREIGSQLTTASSWPSASASAIASSLTLTRWTSSGSIRLKIR